MAYAVFYMHIKFHSKKKKKQKTELSPLRMEGGIRE